MKNTRIISIICFLLLMFTQVVYAIDYGNITFYDTGETIEETNTKLLFEWKSISGAKLYKVAAKPDSGAKVTNEVTKSKIKIDPDELLLNNNTTEIKLWVAAYDKSGNELAQGYTYYAVNWGKIDAVTILLDSDSPARVPGVDNEVGHMGLLFEYNGDEYYYSSNGMQNDGEISFTFEKNPPNWLLDEYECRFTFNNIDFDTQALYNYCADQLENGTFNGAFNNCGINVYNGLREAGLPDSLIYWDTHVPNDLYLNLIDMDNKY